MRQQWIFSGMEWKLRIKRKYQRWLRGLHKPRSGHILRSHRNVSNRLREGVEIVAAALLWREFHCVLWCWKTSSDFDTIEVHTPLRFRRHRRPRDASKESCSAMLLKSFSAIGVSSINKTPPSVHIIRRMAEAWGRSYLHYSVKLFFCKAF